MRHLNAQGEIVETPASALDLSYRHSIFEESGGLHPVGQGVPYTGGSEKISEQMNELMGRRRDKQPLDKPSAGSAFKRPAGAFAGALIDQCGLRGYRHGGACHQ